MLLVQKRMFHKKVFISVLVFMTTFRYPYKNRGIEKNFKDPSYSPFQVSFQESDNCDEDENYSPHSFDASSDSESETIAGNNVSEQATGKESNIASSKTGKQIQDAVTQGGIMKDISNLQGSAQTESSEKASCKEEKATPQNCRKRNRETSQWKASIRNQRCGWGEEYIEKMVFE